MDLEQLIAIAASALSTVDRAPDRLPAPLAYVLVTKRGAVHTVINDEFSDTVQTLREQQNTEIEAILTMWKDGIPDLPSYAFRTALLELNPANAETELLGTGRTLDATMFHG